MRLLLTSCTMGYMSGTPLYVYTLARELAKEHKITVVSPWRKIGNEAEKLREGLEEVGVRCVEEARGNYDCIIASESAPALGVPIVNIIHSEYDCETPLLADAWVAIRPSIKDHIVECHGVPEERAHVIYNGIDRERFKARPKPPRDYKLTVVPCTLDPLRAKFINHLCQQANESNRYHFFGDFFGVPVTNQPWAQAFPAKFHIEEEISTADEVAGILLGRVNLEANSCGVPSKIYHPETLEEELFLLPEEEFEARHNIKNVARQLMDVVHSVI
jgi:hypothetical protein